MKFKLKELMLAVEKLNREMYGWDRDKSLNDEEVEVVLSNENPGSGQFVDCMTFTTAKTVAATSYSKEHEVCLKLEVFSKDTNRPARLTKMQTEEIKEKD